MKRPLLAYQPTGHPIEVTPADTGGWITYCGTCSKREGAYVNPCPTWRVPPPLVLLSVPEIQSVLAGVEQVLRG